MSDLPDAAHSARAELQSVARDALATIARYGRGEIDGLDAARSIVNDELLREIVPIRFLLGFIGVEAEFPAEMDEERAAKLDASQIAELRAERDEILASVSATLAADCAALTAHLEQWQGENPPPSGVNREPAG